MKISTHDLNTLLDCYYTCSKDDPTLPSIISNRDNPNNYQKICPLARGSYGDVFIVRNIHTSKLFAMKRLSKEKIKRHPNTALFTCERNCLINTRNLQYSVSLISSFQDTSYLYFIMNFYEGGDLLSVLARLDVLPENYIVFYVCELLLALEELHSMFYIHRDIKPDNILITLDGHIRLADFGSCTRVDEETLMVESCHPVGTPDYISPEVLNSTNTSNYYGFEVDVWSLGVVVYEMLNGSTPFYSTSLSETYGKICKIEFDNSNGTEKLRSLISCMICEKEKRMSISELKSKVSVDFNIDFSCLEPPFIPEPDWNVNFGDIGFVDDENVSDLGHKGFIGFSYDDNVEIVYDMKSCNQNKIHFFKELKNESKVESCCACKKIKADRSIFFPQSSMIKTVKDENSIETTKKILLCDKTSDKLENGYNNSELMVINDQERNNGSLVETNGKNDHQHNNDVNETANKLMEIEKNKNMQNNNDVSDEIKADNAVITTERNDIFKSVENEEDKIAYDYEIDEKSNLNIEKVCLTSEKENQQVEIKEQQNIMINIDQDIPEKIDINQDKNIMINIDQDIPEKININQDKKIMINIDQDIPEKITIRQDINTENIDINHNLSAEIEKIRFGHFILKLKSKESIWRIKMYLEELTNQHELSVSLTEQLLRENKLLKKEIRKKESQIDIGSQKKVEEIKKELRQAKNEVREQQQKLENEALINQKLEDEIKYLKGKLDESEKIVKFSISNKTLPKSEFMVKCLEFNNEIQSNRNYEINDLKMVINDNFMFLNSQKINTANLYHMDLKENELYFIGEKKRNLIIKIILLEEELRANTNTSSCKSNDELITELQKEENILRGLENMMKVIPKNSTHYDAVEKQKIGTLKKINEIKHDLGSRSKTGSIINITKDEKLEKKLTNLNLKTSKIIEFKNHRFIRKTFLGENVCVHCNNMLCGSHDQGVECTDCKMIVHNWCYILIEESCELYKQMKYGKKIFVLAKSIEEREKIVKVLKMLG